MPGMASRSAPSRAPRPAAAAPSAPGAPVARLGRRRSAAAAALLLGALSAVAAPAAFAGGLARPRPPVARLAVVPRQARGGEGRAVTGTVEPLGSYVLVRLGKPEQKTQGGIVLPSRQKPNEGDIVAVGPGEWSDRTSTRIPVGLAPGKRVMYSKSAYFDKFELEGVEHGLLREDDILLTFDASAGGESKPPPPEPAVLAVPKGRVLVRVDEQKRETEGGLLLSKGAAEEGGSTSTGSVLAVGESEIEGEKPDLVAGDVVYFKYGEEVKLQVSGKEKYMSVRQSDCIAKMKSH